MDDYERLDEFVHLVHTMLAAQREAREQSHPVYAVTAAQLEAQVREFIWQWEVGRNDDQTTLRGEVSEGDRR